jgi:predicted choloylglycine hydrolase
VPKAARPYLPDIDAGQTADWRRYVPEQWRQWLEASPAPRPQSRSLGFVILDEPTPGPAWQALYRETWPAYRSWWLSQGIDRRPERRVAEGALARFMPELVGIHSELVQLTGGSDTAAEMLALWNPPPFIVACSQTVAPDRETGEPVLVRNYDYDPRLFEATIYRSRWSSRRVLGTGDCLWGLVDGMNDSGLAASLTFGGRREIGEGFGIPLVMRYLLEVADSVTEGVDVLGRLPHQLSYNVTLCDSSGAVVTAFVAPDRPLRVTDHRATTNHPGRVEWPEHAAWSKSVERLDTLHGLASADADADSVVGAMLAPPLLARRWDEGFATLFTAAYRPRTGRLTYHWPNDQLGLDIDRTPPATHDVVLSS